MISFSAIEETIFFMALMALEGLRSFFFFFKFENLMSDVGGQLGLWIGVSFITVAEVIKLLLDMIRVLARKFYLTDGEVRDIHEMK